MDLHQKKFLELLSELLHHLSDFIWIKSGAFLQGLNTWKSNGYWSRLTGEWVSTIQFMYTVWPEQCRQHYDTWHLTFSQYCLWEFKSCRLLTLCLYMGCSQHSEGDKNLQNNRNHITSGMASHPNRLKYSLCHLLWAHWDMFPQKWYQHLMRVYNCAVL